MRADGFRTATYQMRYTNLAINYYGNTNWAFDNPNFLHDY